MPRRKLFSALVKVFVVLPVLFAIVGTAYFFVTYRSIDLIRQLEEPSLILDRDGKDIGRFSSEIRQVITLDELPHHLVDAVIAIEDSRYYQHFGVDPQGFARALWRNIRNRRIVEGGSTITQQLAKNEYFMGVTGPARTVDRKIHEAIYAIKLERTYTKDEILERYLNRIYFGHGRFGVEAAAQYYFGKSARELDLAESALLAGIPRGPAIYSLRDHPDNANGRKNLVLARMEELGYISAQERDEAQAMVLEAAPVQERVVRASHFRQRVEREVKEKLGNIFPGLGEQEINNIIYNQGLQIHTTLSLSAQAAAEQMLTERGQALREKNANIQGIVVAMDPFTGGIMALVESIELTGTYRRADAIYNLGSSYKGILYTAALENGYTASSTVICTETAYPNPGGRPDPYRPTDFDGGWHNRELRIREALEVSCNIVAVSVADALGRDKFLSMAARLNPLLANRNIGDASELQLPLGPKSSPINLTLAYAPFVNGGYSVQPHSVTQIRDANGAVLYQAFPSNQPVLDQRLAYIVTNMMQGVRGIQGMPFDAAGKTGTSDDMNTVFVGFTTDMIATVFFGYDNPGQATSVGNAVTVAAPAWVDFLTRYYAGSPPQPFERPPGIEEAVVCKVSGQLATHLCPDTYVELFMPGSTPRTHCTLHAGDTIEICTSTNLPANPYCPEHLRRTVPREPWMRHLQCWMHGPSPSDPPQEEDPQQPEDEGNENDEDDEE